MAKVLMKGNEALAEAALRAGCRFYSGYPITPQTEILEYLSWRMAEVGGQFIQTESELGGINMLYGAGGDGGESHDKPLPARDLRSSTRAFLISVPRIFRPSLSMLCVSATASAILHRGRVTTGLSLAAAATATTGQ